LDLLEDIIEEYMYHCMAKGMTAKTIKNKRQEYKQLVQYLKEKRAITELQSITTHDLKAYVRSKKQSGLQPQSIQSMGKMVRAFFNWCVKEEYLTESPMKKVELPKVPKKVIEGFTAQEIAKMISAFTFKDYLEVRNKAVIALMADCGLRSMEVRGLKESDVRDTNILVNGKGNKERIVFISPALKKILIKYERMKKQYFNDRIQFEDNYFLSYQGKALSHVGIYNLVKEGAKRAGISGKRVSPHMVRHYYAVAALNSGTVDTYSISKLLGHSSVNTTEIYLSSLSVDQLAIKANSSSPLMNLEKQK